MSTTQLHDVLKVRGGIHIRTVSGKGVVMNYHFPNLVLNTGKAIITDRLAGTPTEGVISHMAAGSGATAAAGSQTALVTELGRVALTSTAVVTVTTTNDSVRWVATFGAGTATGTWNELGLSNTASSTITMSRSVIGTIVKTADMSATVTWTLTLV
jgi:hypothetical protein